MSKAILEFKLPEENAEFVEAINAKNVYGALWDFSNFIRNKIKYTPDNQSEEAAKAFDEVRERFYEILQERGIEL